MTIYSRPSPSVPVWAESGDKVQPSNAEVQTGWPASSTPPSRQRFNWVLGFAAQAVRYLLQRGIPEWAAGEDYPENARVQYLGATYKALVGSPTSAPGVVGGEWEAWGLSASDVTTPPQFDDGASIATTAFVRRFGLSARARQTADASTNPTLTVANAGALVSVSGAGSVTLPAAAGYPSGTAVVLQSANASAAVTVQRSGSDQIFAGGANRTNFTLRAGCSAALVSDGSGVWQLAWGSASLQFEAGAPLLGVNQTWQDLTGSRALGVTYTNDTGRPITVQYRVIGSAGVQPTMVIDGVTVPVGGGVNASGNTTACSAVIPPGATYQASTTSLTLQGWTELR